jgi:tetratricopeptide (TPR) repeat protein
MHACPSSEELQNFLDQGLDADYIARILVHVEDCYLCQQALERLTVGISAMENCLAPAALKPELDATVDLAGTEIAAPGDRQPPGNLNGVGPPGARTDECETPGALGEHTEPDPSLASGPVALGVYSGRTETAVRAPESTRDGPETDVSKSVRESGAHGQTRNPSDWPSIPGYEILGALGEGGMGVVYKANHLGLKRHVALKMIRGGSHPRASLLARFRTEAEAVARIRHPNILQIYNIGEAGGLPFVALELLEGGSLGDRLAGEPQPAGQGAELAMTLARAVHVAHEAGIVHRDLKPSNVLYTFDGVPKITDFGLAKRIDSDDGHTESGQVMGSPSYMAPEQARGHSRNVGPAADVYALGAILYEMLTGRPPFRGETPIETIRQVIDDDPVAPSQLVPRVPRDLETISLKCLHKDAARRYLSAQALADDLYRYLHGQVIHGRPTPFWERAAKWSRRHKAAAASVVVGWVTITAMIVGGFVYQQQMSNWVLAQENTGSGLIDGAREAAERDELTESKIRLGTFRGTIQREPRLRVLLARVDKAVASLDGKLADLDQLASRVASHEAERARLEKFRDLWNQASVYDIQLNGLDLATNQTSALRVARAALALFAAPNSGDAWALAAPPESLTQAEQAEVAEGCYGLLLSLAEAEPTPAEGLRRLDEAARLRPGTKAWHLRRAVCLSRAGRSADAEEEHDAAGRTPPTTAFDHFLVGQERYKRGDLSAAMSEFDAALELQPSQFWSQCLRSVCCVQLRQFSEAKTGFTACLQRDDRQPWLFLLRGFSSYQLGVRARMRIEKLPFDEQASRTEAKLQLDAAAADYRRAFELLDSGGGRDLRFPLLVNRGVLRLERGDFEAAEADLNAAKRLDASRLEPLLALAQVYLKLEQPDQASAQFSRAIALEPDEAALYRGRADVQLARKKPTVTERASALGDLETAIKLEKPSNPELASHHAKRARLLAFAHRDVEALAACDAAIKIKPDLEDAHRVRIDLLIKRKQYDDVNRSCSAIIARGKASAVVYELRSLARAELKDFSGAIDDLTYAITIQPEEAALLGQRGWLYIVADAPRLALHDFEAVLQLDGSRADAYNGRGSARLRLGEHREAVADAEKALSLGKPDAQLFYRAARVYALAAVVVAAEVSKNGRESLNFRAHYQERAATLLGETLKQMPEAERAEFLREVIEKDPSLRVLRRRVWSQELSSAADSKRPLVSAPVE